MSEYPDKSVEPDDDEASFSDAPDTLRKCTTGVNVETVTISISTLPPLKWIPDFRKSLRADNYVSKDVPQSGLKAIPPPPDFFCNLGPASDVSEEISMHATLVSASSQEVMGEVTVPSPPPGVEGDSTGDEKKPGSTKGTLPSRALDQDES